MYSGESDQQPRTTEVIIIGGGVIGLSLARALVRRGVNDVTVIDRGSMGSEASSAAAGMLAPQVESNGVDDFFSLACRSREMYRTFAAELREESGIDVELDETGTLYLAFSDEDERAITKRELWQKKAGLSIEKLNAKEVLILEPNVSPSVRAALNFPRDVQVENRRLVSALCEANHNLGVRLLPRTMAQEITTQRQQVNGVKTSGGFVSCSKVVVAAGSWSSTLGTTAPATTGKVLPGISIEPVRGQMLCFEASPRVTRHVIYSPRGYLVPRKDGRVLAGSTSEAVGFDKRVTAAGIHSILTLALEISPALSGLPLLDYWAGLRPKAPDGLPVLGPCVEIKGLYFSSGHYRNGILLAPFSAELMAEAITTGDIPATMQPFVPARFATPMAD